MPSWNAARRGSYKSGRSYAPSPTFQRYGLTAAARVLDRDTITIEPGERDRPKFTKAERRAHRRRRSLVALALTTVALAGCSGNVPHLPGHRDGNRQIVAPAMVLR